jgi:hypothetical protein
MNSNHIVENFKTLQKTGYPSNLPFLMQNVNRTFKFSYYSFTKPCVHLSHTTYLSHTYPISLLSSFNLIFYISLTHSLSFSLSHTHTYINTLTHLKVCLSLIFSSSFHPPKFNFLCLDNMSRCCAIFFSCIFLSSPTPRNHIEVS